MFSRITIAFLCFFTSSYVSASNAVWKGLENGASNTSFRTLTFDPQRFLEQIDRKPLARSTGTASQSVQTFNQSIIELPLPSGQSIKVKATEYSIIEQGAKVFGDFRSWKVVGVDDPAVRGVIDISSNGFHGMLFQPNGETILIEPELPKPKKSSMVSSANPAIQRMGQRQRIYKSYKRGDEETSKNPAFSCGVHSVNNPVLPELGLINEANALYKRAYRSARNLRNYRIAMAATGEFSEYFFDRGLDPNLAIQTILSRVNAIYNRDLAVNLQLVNDNFRVVFPDRFTDPYPFNNDSSLIDTNTSVLDQRIGSAAYDIGHVLTRFRSSTGGVAILGSVCVDSREDNNKGAGTTGSRNPADPTFAIDFVAHEIGHQLGATHTFNSVTGSCSGDNRQPEVAFEPGGGSSIMAYAGICDPNNIADHSVPAFHIASIEQINENIRSGRGRRCGEELILKNNAPEIINITSNLTVNAGDTFVLSGAAMDADGDALTYSWDQVDAGKISNKFVDMGDNALFQFIAPTESADREFAGLAQTNRQLHFKLVVRDGRGGVSTQETTVQVINGSEPPPPGTRLPSEGSGGKINIGLLLFLALLLLILKRTRLVCLTTNLQRMNNR